MLRNPAYVGRPGWNRRGRGTYTRFVGGEEVRTKPNTPHVENDRADWIMPAEALYPAVVERHAWDAVQAKLDARPAEKRAPKSAALWLSRLVYCGTCNRPMMGKIETRTRRPQYICATYVEHVGVKATCGCTSNIVNQSVIEGYLSQWFSDTGEQLAGILEATDRNELLPWQLGEAVQRMIRAHERMRDRLGLPEAPGIDIEELSQRYEQAFYSERPQHEAALADLERQHDAHLDGMMRIPREAKLALEKAQRKLVETEGRIGDVRAKLDNASDAWLDAANEITRQMRDWRAAQVAVTAEAGHRSRSEAIRRVVDRIVLTFAPPNKRRPTHMLRRVQIVAASPQSPAWSKSASGPDRMMSNVRSGCPCP